MSVTSILEVQFQPDRLDEGVAVLARALRDTRAFDGCLSVTVVQDHEDPTRVLAVERWASLEADAAYRAWRAGDGAISDLPGTLAGPPRLTVAVERDDL